jgi:hypothetical protein
MSGFNPPPTLSETAQGLGPAGPFPAAALRRSIDRRWLHYAFLSTDGRHAMVANTAWLGPSEDELFDGDTGEERLTTILLLHDSHGVGGWRSSQFNAKIAGALPWSAFARPFPHGQARGLSIGTPTGTPAVDLSLFRTSQPCTSQCAFFARHQHLRWQSETGVRGLGSFDYGAGPIPVDLIGYHERVRGRWAWPDLGEWVFGFANDLSPEPGKPPRWAGVFTFIRPTDDVPHATASFMLWKDGRMRRHFPRRATTFAVRGELPRDRVTLAPPLASLLGVAPMTAVPRRLAISARQGDDWVVLDFDAETAVRIVIPSETSLNAFSVHELLGDCLLTGKLNGEKFAIETRGIVEFSGGADDG